MSFTYYPNVSGGSGFTNLRNKYFVRLASDNRHLVPGILQQGRGPSSGRWLDVETIDRTFAERYFVQYTDFNTLVPGSLIPSIRKPEGKWKEVKSSAGANFHRIVFSDQYIASDVESATAFEWGDDFIVDKMYPVLDELFPGTTDIQAVAKLYFFKGDFEALVQDTTQLEPFGEGALMWVYFAYVGSTMSTIGLGEGFGLQLFVSPDLPDGVYSLILEITTPPIGQFLVFENVFLKNTSGGD